MEHARTFAAEAHAGQEYNLMPYTVHLEAVAMLVREVADPGSDPDFLETVAWLHDVIEDTDVTEAQVADTFGHAVAEAVSLLSDPPGCNRRERKQRLHERLGRLDERQPVARAALLVKVADRLANVRAAADKRPGLLKMYRLEHAEFRYATFRFGLCNALWRALDRLLDG